MSSLANFASQVANQTENNDQRMEEEVLAQVSIIHYLDICWLPQEPQNIGRCPQRLNHHQTTADGFKDWSMKVSMRMSFVMSLQLFLSLTDVLILICFILD